MSTVYHRKEAEAIAERRKRINTPARQAATERYAAKTYRKINIALRVDEDKDIIKSIDEAREAGQPLREWVREQFEK